MDFGRVVRVDLTKSTVEEERIDARDVEEFLGCSGLACAFLLREGAWRHPPLDPRSPLVFATGLITATIAPTVSRFAVCGRSPQTGIWGEANSGGRFGVELRRAGVWLLSVTGRAARPVSISVQDARVEILDTPHLKGLDSFKTQEVLGKDLGNRASVACIGEAGERLVKFAAVMNDEGRAAARTGMGCLMGSKNLKAVAARGTGKPALADPARFLAVGKAAFREVNDAFATKMLQEIGTSGYLDMAMMYGDAPVRYFTKGGFEGAYKLSGATMKETILVKPYHCTTCPIGCGRVVAVPEGPYKTDGPIEGPEYEGVTAFGTLLEVDDLAAVSQAFHLCNHHGLDVISTGVVLGFAMHLRAEGVLTERHLDGLDLRFGNADAVLTAIGMIARREGFGDVLAEGVRAMGARFGRPADAAHVKGLEIPMHDPRAFHGVAVQYATSPRGACHKQGEFYEADIGLEVPDLGIVSKGRFEGVANVEPAARDQDLKAVYNALSMCQFSKPAPQGIADMIAAALGKPFTLEDILRTGDRLLQLKRVFNVLCGVRAADDTLPKILLTPVKEGGTEGKVPDVAAQVAAYYRIRGWDADGVPTNAALERAGVGWAWGLLAEAGVRR